MGTACAIANISTRNTGLDQGASDMSRLPGAGTMEPMAIGCPETRTRQDFNGTSDDIMRRNRKAFDLHRYCELLETAARDEQNNNLGLHYGKELTPDRLVGERLSAQSSAAGISLHALVRDLPYQRQNTHTAFRQADGYCRLEYKILDGFILERRQDAELTMGLYLNTIRRCLGVRWSPEEVHFEHPKPEYWQEHESVFNAPAYFNMKTNALVFRERSLKSAAPGWTLAQLKQQCEALLPSTAGIGLLSLTQQVAGEIRALLPSGYPHIEQVAESLNLTRWTLQRRLADEAHVFSDIVEQVRRRLARLYLAEAHLAINDIAGILGYSELSAFSRACVRWFKAPPSRVRGLLLDNDIRSPAKEAWPAIAVN